MAPPNLASMTYEPVPELPGGAVKFYDANEKPTLLYGPPAAELAARIDRTKAALESQKAERTADNAHQPKFAALDKIGNFGGPEPVPAAVMDVATRGAAPPVTAPASVQPTLAPAPEGAPAGPRNLGFGRRLTADGRIQRLTGGAPAVTKEMLEARDANAVAQRVAQSTTTTGGFDPSIEYLKGKLRVASERNDLLEEIRGQNVRSAITEQESAKERAALAAQFQADQLKLNQEIETRVKQDEQIAEQARKEYTGSKVNPERLFQGEGGTLRALTYALSAGLGAFGATLGRTENFAAKAIDGIIDRDIRAQEAEIAVKGKTADNAMAQLQRSGLSRDQSRLLLRQLQSDFVAARANELRAGAKISEEDANYKALKLKHDEDTLDFLEKYRRESLGTRTQQVQSQFAHPRAATAGGWADVPDQIGEAKSLQGIRKTDAEIAKTEAEAKAGPDTKAIPTERTSKIADNIQAVAQALKVRDMLGTQDSETFEPSGSLTPRVFESGSNYAQLEQATNALVTTEQKASGIGSTEDDRKNVEAKIRGNNTTNARRRGVDMIAQDAAQRTVAEMSGLSPADQARILEGMPAPVRDIILKQMSK